MNPVPRSNMQRNRTIQLVCVLGVAVCIGAAALLSSQVQARRDALQLDSSPELGGRASPQMVLLAAGTGAFRGIFIDVLWYRIENLKQEGKFFEIHQLADLITTLQPRFAEVWRYHAWNMAYNISVSTHTPQERWDWVNKGLALLRDKGIPYNPRSVNLYRELGWIFSHKIGQYSDDMHWFYKRRLAYEWQEVLGTPTRGVGTAEAIDRFRKIAQAPPTLRELIQKDAAAGKLVAALGTMAQGVEDDPAPLLREIGRVFMFNYLEGDSLVDAAVRELPQAYRPQLTTILTNADTGAGLPGLLAFLRRRAVEDVYHMDVQYMLALMERYGPLDWRHPAAHGAYWSERGMDIAEGVRTHKGLDLINTNRQTIHAMQELASTGDIVFDPITEYIDMSPDVRFIPAYIEAVEVALRRVDQSDDAEVTSRREVYAAGFENFLLRSVTYAYLYGDRANAQEYYDKCRDLFGTKPDAVRSGRYQRTLEETVLADLGENLENWDRTTAFLSAMFYTAFQKGLGNARGDVFDHFLALARQVHQRHEARAIADPRAVQRRMSIGEFEQLLVKSFERFMLEPGVDLLVRARVWSNAPLRLRQEVYDALASALRNRALQAGFDFDRAFPEPEGMQAIRASRPQQPKGDETIPDTPIERK